MAGVWLTGCVHSSSGSAYTHGQARQAMDVSYGTVLSVRPVRIEGTRSGAGTVIGGVAGAVGGSQIGGGRGRVWSGLGGAAVGAIAGTAVEELATGERGIEITVRLDDQHVIAVVQSADEMFQPNERVCVLHGADGVTRVQH